MLRQITMTKYRRNILLSYILIILSLMLIGNELRVYSKFRYANILSHIGLLLLGVFYLYLNKRSEKNNLSRIDDGKQSR